MKCKPSQLIAQIPHLLEHNIVPYIHGSPALGKSAISQAIADKFNLKLIDIRLADYDPTDITGFPIIDPESGLARHVPFDTFPTTETPVPEGYKGWLVLFDEFSSAPRAVQAATYKLILDRCVGQHKLHNRCKLMAAGNKEDDNAIVIPMSSALISRFAHFYLEPDHEEWMEWAAKAGVDHRISSYLGFKPDHLYTFNPSVTEAYASPRTWDMLSRVISGTAALDKFTALISGLVGEGVANEFIAYSRLCNDLPSIDEIIKNPEGVRIKDEISIKWALMGSVTHHINLKNQEQLYKFLDRLSADLRVVALREINNRHPELCTTPEYDAWHTRTAEDAF